LPQPVRCHSFTRASDGTITYLPDVVPGGSTVAYYLNDNGVFVGFYSTGSELIFPGSLLTLPTGLNDYGMNSGGYLDTTGNFHGFVAVPVP